ncbi:DNA-binding protein [Flavobacterium orientale]|uniref:DNA-binding protein n=2 Tax=Flavobacterium orientale TaxID=1756020 RepID=A0A916XXU2_9FLAO|nr:DNA-binding protein [Flavobacterium orientale]
MQTEFLGQIDVEMKVSNEFLIPFIGLKQGKHQFDYQIDKTFFDRFEYDEFENCAIQTSVVLDKKSTMLELQFKHKGTVNVPCDVTGEPFDLPIKGKIKLVVQFGDAFNDENEELLILPHGEHQIDISQYIYEMIVLSVPLKRVHPGVKDGTLQSEAIEKLEELAVKGVQEENITEETDPRWDQLKKLLTDK